MYKLSLLVRSIIFGLFLLGFTIQQAAAQIQYANSVTSVAGIVTDGLKAADGNLTTSAVIKPTLALGYTRLRVAFPLMGAAGKPAGMYIQPNVLVSLALLGGATINTYAVTSTGTVAGDSYTLANNLLSLTVQASGITQIAFTPTKQFNQIELVFFSVLALGEDIAIYESYSTPSPLPVQLTAFRGQVTPTGVALNWETASELNSDYFAVERADGSPESFHTIGTVQGAGSSTQARHYQLVDTDPASLSYYRLRQVDLDGTTSFSSIVVIKTAPLATTLSAYPSPATESLTVAGAAGAHIAVFDQMGRQVRSTDLTAAQLQQIDVSSLPVGIYIVRDTTTGNSLKFTKIGGQ